MCENNLLIKLEKLLNFGEVNLLKIDISKHDFKLSTIYALIGVIHYHSGAILILSKNGKLFSSEIILRSLFEGFINLKYILLGNDEKNAIKFTIKNFADNKEFTKKWKIFIKKTNKHTNFFPELSTAEKCDEFMEKMEKEINNIEEKFGVLKRFPNCRALSEEIDKIDENHTFELMYLTIYEYLSGLVHISSKGLKNFFISNENGYTFNFSRNEPKEIKKVLVAVYEIYLNTLEILNQNFTISDKNKLQNFKNFFIKIGGGNFIVMTVSIIIDISRSRVLMKTAKKYNRALEADALHFSTDVWSSSVVILGLIALLVSRLVPKLQFLEHADAIAALVVAAIVIWVSIRLGFSTVKALIDSAPKGSRDKIIRITEAVPGVKDVHNIRIRTSGAHLFVDIHIMVDGEKSLKEVHYITDRIELDLKMELPEADITVHPEPGE